MGCEPRVGSLWANPARGVRSSLYSFPMTEHESASAPAIHRPTSAAEVAELLVRAARENVPLTVVSGGHGHWSYTPAPGIRIELGALSAIEVDGATVRIGPGAVWGDVAEALAPHGVAISAGDTATVGVGGLTVGGGIGWMVRAWGLAVDQLDGVQIVTADGQVREANADENADLFWAVRGGGGNFGIVTRFDFRAHPTSGIAHGESRVAAGSEERMLRALRDVLHDAPRELTVTYMDVPAMDPSAPAGASLVSVWAAPEPDRLAEILAPVTAIDGVATEITTPAYRDILLTPPEGAEGAEAVGPPAMIGGNGLFAELDDELIDRLVTFRRTYPASVIFLRSLGGAFSDVPQGDTAFPARHATWFVMAMGFDIPGLVDDAMREGIRADWARIAEGRAAVYGNFLPMDRPDEVPAMFDRDGFERLHALKRHWDPQNLLRRNHNIVG